MSFKSNQKNAVESIKLIALLSTPGETNDSMRKRNLTKLIKQTALNNKQLTQRLRRHKVCHCAHSNLSALGVERYDLTVKALSQTRLASTKRQMALFNQSVSICTAFNQAGITHRSIKGFGLSSRLYPDKYYRDCKDIDIWIPRLKLNLAHQILVESGATLYKPRSLSNYEHINQRYKDLCYKVGQQGILELHIRLLPVKSKFSDYLDNVLLNRGLTQNEEFIYLCMHGVISGFYRLRWLTDLHLYVQNEQINISEVLRLSKKYNANRYVLTSLYLLEKVFGTQPFFAKTQSSIQDRISATIAAIICFRIMTDNREQNEFTLTFKCDVLKLICTSSWHDFRQYLSFLFGPSLGDYNGQPQHMLKRTKTFFNRLIKLLKS